MSEYLIDLIARSLAAATVAMVVTLPMAFLALWAAKKGGVFSAVGWPDPTNEQMLLIALFVAVFSR
jgi:hypothetical protein